MRCVDLRSDTVTQPTDAMRLAMMNAEVGDDVACDDPTVNRLEALAAEITGKENALFVASGTMGNLVAIMSHTQRGDEAIVGSASHIFLQEVAGAAVVAGVSLRTVSCMNDIPDVNQLLQAIRPDDIHEPTTTLICLENALSNGRVVSKEIMREVYEAAHAHGLHVHVDGARIWNAAAALDVDVKELTQYCDSITCCVSKGLCAPVGAVLCGTNAFIARSRKNRKMLGGGMRECGILAAAGICALSDMRSRLKEDHDNAKYLADQLSKFASVHLDLDAVETNMVFCTIDRSPAELAQLPQKMRERQIKICGMYNGHFRFVTNHDVSRADIDYFVRQLAEVLGEKTF